MATKLKNMRLTSVDLVRAGANQEADICLFKSDNPVDPETVEKEYTTFNQINDGREAFDQLWRYTEALNSSIRSIAEDQSLDVDSKEQLMKKSLQQFDAAMSNLIGKLAGVSAHNEDITFVVAAKSLPVYDHIREIESKKA